MAGEHFPWDASLETGDELIDDQHRSLFALANNLQDAIETHADDAETVTDAVYRLTDYVVEHFADEEAFMDRCGYPAAECHKKLHGDLTAQTMSLAARAFNGEDLLPATIAPFLTAWLTGHIRAEDMLLVAFARSTGASA